MPAIKVSTPKGQKGIEAFLSTKKRSPPECITSPTNQTSSPEQKKAAVNDKTGNPEDMSNEPSPALMNPQRDKFGNDDSAIKDKEDVTMEDVKEDTQTVTPLTEQKSVEARDIEIQKETKLKEPEVHMERTHETTKKSTIPNTEMRKTDETETGSLANSKEPNQEKKVRESPKEQVKLKPALKNTF